MPALDAFLGVAHADDPLRPYLLEMRDYMTPEQRAFLAAVEAGPSLRELLLARQRVGSRLRARPGGRSGRALRPRR